MTDERKPIDPSAIIIPFGKHKGATVAELLARDPAYADWVTGQGWVAERFAELHAAILSRGAGTDDTPEHNALQIRFLDKRFREAVILLLVSERRLLEEQERVKTRTIEWLEGQKKEQEHILSWANQTWRKVTEEDTIRYAAARAEIFSIAGRIDLANKTDPLLSTAASFEEKGVDVVLTWGFSEYLPNSFKIEIKPSLGDDYPSVMRQMKRLGAWVLVVDHYTGRGAAEPQLREALEVSGLHVIFLQEIEEALRANSP